VVFCLLCLVLEVMLSDRDILLIVAVHFLVMVVIASGNYNLLGAPLSSLFAFSWHLSWGLWMAPPCYCQGPLSYRLGQG
jgi:hypothetical protein